MAKITLILILTVICAHLALGSDGPDDMCLKCLCHGRTGCYWLRNCASYSIKIDYWRVAGSPSIGGSSEMDSYKICMKNDDCIRTTIRGYIKQHDLQDCNNDGEINCKDYAMIHYEGENCGRTDFDVRTMTYVDRLDNCLAIEMPKIGQPVPASGWEIIDVPAE